MKRLLCSALLASLFILAACPAFAQVDTGVLPDALDRKTRGYLDKAGAGDGLYDGGNIDGLFDAVGQMAAEAAAAPLKSGGIILFIIILNALIGSAAGGEGGTTAAASSVISLCAAASSLAPISVFLEEAGNTVTDGCGFTAVFVPLYAGLMTASGKPLAAAGYGAAALAAGELCSAAVIRIVLPLTRIFLALSVCSAAYPALKCDRLTSLAGSSAKWLFTVSAMLYAGILSVTNAVSSSQDGAAYKAVRFAFSAAVPVAGSAMGDALSAVRGSVSVLRASVGGFGMIAVAFVFLPPIMTAAAWSMVLGCCASASEALGGTVLAGFLRSAGSVIDIILSLLIYVSFVLIISTAITVGGA